MRYTAATVAAATLLSGCGVMETRNLQNAIGSDAHAAYADAPRSRPVFRVRVGPFTKRDDAEQLKEKLDGAGVESVLVRVQR